ncbi:hypothetical protein [Gordonia sp. YY1]|uniref:hypothetical protein n=1 Tax=Gordonia sp. YY1 TaxID=396712 RepID=UPI001331C27A|nr:hypothetical protein [Gordonia sp. YY1]KAF0967828.1 hypothetical protein BPODLACK_03783 [Gordonia sp. YY1]
MTATAAAGDIANLVEQTTALGGTIPTELVDIIATIDAVNHWDPPQPGDLASLCRRGDLTADNAATILDAALVQPNRQPGDLKITAKHELTQRFTHVLAGPAGDELVKSLRPAFQQASTNVADAANLIAPGDRVDILTDADDDTIRAWRTLGEHKATLDRVSAVIDLLTDRFEVLGVPQPWHVGNAIRAAMYTPDADHLALVARALLAPNGTGGARAGRWHSIAAALTLNTPSVARAILDTAHHTHLEEVAAERNKVQTNEAATRPGRTAA